MYVWCDVKTISFCSVGGQIDNKLVCLMLLLFEECSGIVSECYTHPLWVIPVMIALYDNCSAVVVAMGMDVLIHDHLIWL